MLLRWAKVFAASLLMLALWLTPAHAQSKKNQPAPAPTEHKPVVEYIAVFVLLGIPIGLICRSSRRQT
jgi:hypothetical protein